MVGLLDGFFDAIRCGLMHDGETRRGWRIRQRHQTRIIEQSGRGHVLYRGNFHEAIKKEFEDFTRKISAGALDLRANFLARMDTICGLIPLEKPVRYFAYGSNMNHERITKPDRAPHAVLEGFAQLPGYRVVFNKRSTNDGTAKANIVASGDEKAVVRGALYRIEEEEFECLKRVERGYILQSVQVNQNGAKIRAQTFIAEAISVYTCSPSPDYLSILLEGARTLNLGEDYIDFLRSSAADVRPCQ